MANNILNIKINIPPIGSKILLRPNLVKTVEQDLEIQQGFSRPLTLISAPAGFGKTTLARALLSQKEACSAWLSLDQRDNERNRFWLYLVSALQTLQENLGTGTMEILRSSGLGSEEENESETLLAPLLNDLFFSPESLFLVLDDYHLINNPQIHEDMVFFLENLPSTLHIVVTTRSEPPWPLARWRGKGKMGEVRQKDLRFSPEETQQLFSRIEGLQLQEAQVKTLYQKTEGWVTGLQLAAISLANNPDRESLIESFAGSHRHVFHFLSEEVFAQQPEHLRNFLLQTSILSRFSVSLCNAVTAGNEGLSAISSLERDNIFLTPLDDRGEWFRYHPLFTDLLSHKLKAESPEIIPTLNERAANWFLKAGEPGEAIRHAQKGDNLNLAAEILDRNLEGIIEKEGPGVVIRSLENLPEAILRSFPQLVLQKGWFHLVHKGKDEARIYLEIAEDLIKNNPELKKEIGGMLAVVKAYYNIYAHEFPLALENAEKALELLPEHDIYWRSKVGIISGDARLFSCNPRGAYDFYLQAHQQNQKADNFYLIMSSGFKLATALYFLGKLEQAEKMTTELLENGLEKGFAKVPRIGLLWTLLGELEREKGDLKNARNHIEKGIQISQPEKPSLAWNLLFKIALSFSSKDFSTGLKTVQEIEDLNHQFELPNFILQPALAWKALLLFKTKQEKQAFKTLSSVGISPDQPARQGQEQGFLVLARLMENKEPTALKIFKEIEDFALKGESQRVILETLIQKAKLEEKKGNQEGAEKDLKSALERGLDRGYHQIFQETCEDLIPVLKRIMEKGEQKSSTLSSDSLENIVRSTQSPAPNEKEQTIESSSGNLPGEQLSKREIEILSLLAEGNSNKEVAEILFLSPGTVKWHTSNIYGKLGANGRTHAIARARELKIIP